MVIIAYIAAEQQSHASENDYGKALVQALKPAGNNLAKALQRVFSLTEEQAKSQAHDATERYKEAERQARQR
jgi:flagellar hook-basal body complex protein FliE